MSFQPPSQDQKPAFAYMTVGAFAFVVGSLVTLQFATLENPSRNASGDGVEDVTRSVAGEILAVTPQGQGNAAVQDAAPELTAVVDPTSRTQKPATEVGELDLGQQMRLLTDSVVAGLYDIQASDGQGSKMGRIILTSNAAGDPASAVEQLLSDAAQRGDIKVPEALSLQDGSIDSRTLLFELVHTALENGSPEAVNAAREMRRRAFAASAATTQEINGERFYVVEDGDSLAYISLQFYGKTSLFDKIYEANQDILSSPDKIRVGQRLRIPS